MSAMERTTVHRTVLTQLAVMSAHVMEAIWMKAMDLCAQVRHRHYIMMQIKICYCNHHLNCHFEHYVGTCKHICLM